MWPQYDSHTFILCDMYVPHYPDLCVLQVQTSIQQGKLQASDTEKAKTQFIVSNWS